MMNVAHNIEVTQCLKVLKAGGIILYPTDTIWGIGCDATNAAAIDRIINLKKRSPEKSMVILLDSSKNLTKYVAEIPQKALAFIADTKRPTTVVYSSGRNLASNVYSKDGSVAIRIVKHSFCESLIRHFGKPIVSTSANISNEPAPAYFSQINQTVLDGVDYVVNLQHDSKAPAVPSTIIKVDDDGNINILRE